MTTDGHARHEHNAGAYLLGSLSELERQSFEQHLARCEDCRAEVDELRPAVEALPRAVAPAGLPPSLKASLMAIVEREARERGGASPRRRRLRLPMLRPRVGWAAAAATLALGVVAGAGVAGLVEDEGDGGTARTIALRADAQRVPSAAGSLTIAADHASGVLRVRGMPVLPEDRVYQLWLQRDGTVIPQSLFRVDAGGEGSAAVVRSLADADVVMVTREPARGSVIPSERPLLTVHF